MIKTGDIVRIPSLGHDLHVIIGQATSRGWWVQNLRTGALPTTFSPYLRGFLPKEMEQTGAKHLTYAQLDCQQLSTNHSDDTVTIHDGSGKPRTMCGFHEYVRPESLVR